MATSALEKHFPSGDSAAAKKKKKVYLFLELKKSIQ